MVPQDVVVVNNDAAVAFYVLDYGFLAEVVWRMTSARAPELLVHAIIS
jgi:hypothetical protein